MGERYRLTRRALLSGSLGTALLPRRAEAFGQASAFHPRVLRVSGSPPPDAQRLAGVGRWAWELIRRTSAPARLVAEEIQASDVQLTSGPLALWFGNTAVGELTNEEVENLRRFFSLGGFLLVDDSEPIGGAFSDSVKRQLARVLPQHAIDPIPAGHVLFKSYYLIDEPVGRVVRPGGLEGIRGGRDAHDGAGRLLSVVVSRLDLFGALAQNDAGGWAIPLEPGVRRQREMASRLALNIALYLLCLDYKDDQVHAEELMRRRGRR